MKVWFPEFCTEAHKRWRRGMALAECLEAEGIEVSLRLDSTCDGAFCGASWLADEFQAQVERHLNSSSQAKSKGLKVVHYCWDLYPMHMERRRPGMDGEEHARWLRYASYLKEADLVLVPSCCTAERVRQYAGRGSQVVLSSCDPWWEKSVSTAKDGGYVVDVMRKYPDPNQHAVAEACSKLGIPFRETGASLPWDEYREVIAGARLLVCAYHEASTGGLTLLEGYALGKRVLVSDSPWLGAKDYFGERAGYFAHGSHEDLGKAIEIAMAYPLLTGLPGADRRYEARNWVREHYTDQAFAHRLAVEMKEALR